MLNQLIIRQYDGNDISQRAPDSYFEALQMAGCRKKRWYDYERLSTTRAFIRALSESAGIPAHMLVQKTGYGRSRKIFIHPQLAMHFAQWVEAGFAVRVSEWVVDLLTHGVVDIRSQPQHTEVASLAQTVVSLVTKMDGVLTTVGNLSTQVAELAARVVSGGRGPRPDDAFVPEPEYPVGRHDHHRLTIELHRRTTQAFIYAYRQTGREVDKTCTGWLYRLTWDRLMVEFYNRWGVNLKLRAANRDMDVVPFLVLYGPEIETKRTTKDGLTAEYIADFNGGKVDKFKFLYAEAHRIYALVCQQLRLSMSPFPAPEFVYKDRQPSNPVVDRETIVSGG